LLFFYRLKSSFRSDIKSGDGFFQIHYIVSCMNIEALILQNKNHSRHALQNTSCQILAKISFAAKNGDDISVLIYFIVKRV